MQHAQQASADSSQADRCSEDEDQWALLQMKVVFRRMQIFFEDVRPTFLMNPRIYDLRLIF